MNNSPVNEVLDSELAELLEDDIPDNDSSDLFSLLEIDEDIIESDEPKQPSLEEFPEITQFEQTPDTVFLTKDYYSKVLHGEGDAAQTMHELLLKFTNRETKGSSDLRIQLTNAWWDLTEKLVNNYRLGNVQKRWALRFSYILPNLITENQRQMLARVVADNNYSEPIHYMDEWLDMIATDDVNPLAVDEELSTRNKAGKSGNTENTRLKDLLSNNKGLIDASNSYLRNVYIKRDTCEKELQYNLKQIMSHVSHPTLKNYKCAYTEDQKRCLNLLTTSVKELTRIDRDIASQIRQLENLTEHSKSLEQLLTNSSGGVSEDTSNNVRNEFQTLKRLIKFCIGRQGNHFPFLLGHYLPSNINLISTRENIILCMKEIEDVDPSIFIRTFKRQSNRIVPHTIILPCYGDRGVCWEPYERFKRATSRGRIAIPLFPRDVKIAIVYALGDLRWNVAKEEAAHYWMNEGLTGMYYQWFMQNNRGDAKKQFLEDYYMWVTKEVDGIQKLDNEVRSIFWRYIPFKQSIKEILRDRGYVYNELYRKDMNRMVSDGY